MRQGHRADRSWPLIALCLMLCLQMPLPAQPGLPPAALPDHVTAPRPQCVPITTPASPHVPRPFPTVFENFPGNVAVFRLVNAHRSPLADRFFMTYYWLGNGYFLLPVGAAVLLWRRKMFGTFLLAISLDYLLVNLMIKPLFAQPRPPQLLDHVHILHIMLVPTPFAYSFPSGDVAQAFATAVPFMADARWQTQLLLFTYAALIGYERMYVGVHFPLDVLVGALVGTLSAAAALWLVGQWRKATVLSAEEMAK